jgi:dimethylargininase
MAVTREIPDTFSDALVAHYTQPDVSAGDATATTKTTTDKDVMAVDMDLVREQHNNYIEALYELGCKFVLRLEADNDLPDCPFVEDTTVVIRYFTNDDSDSDGIIKTVLLNPGHHSRQPEVDTMRDVLPEYLTNVYDMASMDTRARCDGGDILYTGRHLFVGVSERTNEEALGVLEQVFHEIPLIPVQMPKHAPVLHLKSAVTHLDERTLLAPTAPWANQLLRNMRLFNELENEYEVIRIPDVLACNAVVLPDGVMLQKTECMESRKVLQQAMQARDLNYSFVDTSELAKKDAALTCCSILFPCDTNAHSDS